MVERDDRYRLISVLGEGTPGDPDAQSIGISLLSVGRPVYGSSAVRSLRPLPLARRRVW